ncbi:MAG TPA: polyphosphate kinase 2 [Parvularcula sp.]|nr:polyphosphate kinase 2 [Parvularcula sp.]HBS32079.1 polyphosphate kinase 2 [Parvularcula sp.]HBS36138.1 polyphosphate kinase 2 [Parvularcula sp.]
MKKEKFEEELDPLEFELAKLQETVARKGAKVAIVFEGRDAAGKGGVIKTILRRMNPRIWRVVALPKPSDRETTQWYFQRYVAHLPAAGEIVLFDRSWYNRAVVEPVMGWCSPSQYETFMKEVPEFERMLVASGTILLKYWIHVSAEEQERRFQERASDPAKRWKLSPIDLEGRKRWAEFSKYRNLMLEATNTDYAPWRSIDGDDKEKARLNCIRSILDCVPYEFNEEAFSPIPLPPRQTAEEGGYKKSGIEKRLFVKDYYKD